MWMKPDCDILQLPGDGLVAQTTLWRLLGEEGVRRLDVNGKKV